jgi:starch synthase
VRVASIAPEMAPYARTGGLADVAGALPLTLATCGYEVIAVLPKYRAVDARTHALAPRGEEIRVPVGTTIERARLWEGRLDGVRVILIEHEGYYGREGLYQHEGVDYPDNAERFIFFARAALEALRVLGWQPDVIHCHDWQSGLVPAYLRAAPNTDPFFARAASLFTIHNLGYQGLFPAEAFSLTGLPGTLFTPAGIEFWGRVNFLKAGLTFADILNTVSPTYSREIVTPEFGYGLDALLRQRASDLYGVLNGVDYRQWHPRTDPYLVANYSAEDLGGKAACKRELQALVGLPTRADAPLLAVVSRLAHQKGIDLIVTIAGDLFGLDVQVVALGTGEADLERQLRALQERFPDRCAVRVGFDIALSHKIQAAADILLMPSRYEPCGLTQIYALAYGTVPIVSSTGGFCDTVVPFDSVPGTGNGFLFARGDAGDLLRTVRRAVELFRDQDRWIRLMRSGMTADFSWERPAGEYGRLYRLAAEKGRGRLKGRRVEGRVRG